MPLEISSRHSYLPSALVPVSVSFYFHLTVLESLTLFVMLFTIPGIRLKARDLARLCLNEPCQVSKYFTAVSFPKNPNMSQYTQKSHKMEVNTLKYAWRKKKPITHCWNCLPQSLRRQRFVISATSTKRLFTQVSGLSATLSCI